VPFSPYFVSAVRAGRVASIATRGDTIQGTFKVAVRYPAQTAAAPVTRLFSTEVPTFWNDNQLTALLQTHGIQVNATRRHGARRYWPPYCSGLGRRC
jgi:cell division protease FtsH